MKGFIKKAVALLGCAAAAAGSGGCYTYRDLVDPCYPERYNYMARNEVNAAMAPQVANGHVLDQTVWNYFFEPGSDRLTPLGLDRLAYMARRRPCPDQTVYLQTAQDVVFDPAAPEKLVQVRRDLDERRIAAVQRFLTAQTADRGLAFQVLVHDPAETSLASIPVNRTVNFMYFRFMGMLRMGGGMGGGMGGMGGGMGGMGGGMGGMGGGMNAGGMGGGGMGGSPGVNR